MEMPWWMEGVSFSCQPDCGKCCDQPGGIVFLKPMDAEILAKHHSMSVEEWLERDCDRTIDGRFILKSDDVTDICIYLEGDKKCSVYESRPSQCKAYPFWSENLRSDKSWNNTISFCPGINADDAIKVDGNTIRLKVIDDREALRGFRSWPPKAR